VTPQPRVIPIGGTTDATGALVITVRGFRTGMWASWNLFLVVAGAVSFNVVVASDGVAVGGGPAQGTSTNFGPVWSYGTAATTITVTGAPAGATVTGQIQGLESDTLEDVAGTAGPGFSTVGAAQQDPSQLLVGQVGPPLVENFAANVPGSGSHLLFVGQYNVAGYAALLFYADPPAASSNLFAWLRWLDADGSVLAVSQLDAINPKVAAVIGCLTASFQLWIGNTSANVHNVAGLTLVPLAQMPAHPEQLIPVVGGDFSGIVPLAPPAPVIISGVLTVPFATVSTIAGSFVWPGKAIWSVGSLAGSSVLLWDATLQCVDAAGVATVIARLGSGAANPEPVVVQLTSGIAQVVYHNSSASGSQNAQVELIATS
jgi:hypothetical protein